ncbi:protoglobin domain-containing protein [Devosia sp. CAU 1758]
MQDNLQQRLDFIGLGEGVEAKLAPISASVAEHLDGALQRFNARIATTPSAARFLYGRDNIEGNNGGPAAHWHALAAGRLDAAFAEAAAKTGQRHARIGVDPRWHAGCHAVIAQALVRGVIGDGIAAALRQRRGPLGLLAADPAPVLAASEVMAEGLSALVGAIVLDLDLTFSGYAEKLRQEAQAGLAAQQARLRRSVEEASMVLELAAEGRRDDALMAQKEADLAPLRASAEKLADRVGGLIEDLDVSGRAVKALAAEVLESGRLLVETRSAQVSEAGTLTAVLTEEVIAAGTMSSHLADLTRAGRAQARRCSKGRRALDAVRSALDTFPLDADREHSASEKADALSYAANLLAARFSAGESPSADGKPLDEEMRALSMELAQLAAQLRAGQDRTLRAVDDAGAALDGVAALMDRISEESGAGLRMMAALERDGQRQAASLAAASGLAQALEDDLQADLAKVAGIDQRLKETIEGAESLVGLADMLAGKGQEPDLPDTCNSFSAPDHTALAAHWHVL